MQDGILFPIRKKTLEDTFEISTKEGRFMKKTINQWEGQLEDSVIEYNSEQQKDTYEFQSDVHVAADYHVIEFDKADKMDYLVAASCGVLSGLLDSFWAGEFSLYSAQNWGKSKVELFVIKVAQMRGYRKSELSGAIRFLEKEAPIPSDRLTLIWGGGLQHHFRDFVHHASIVGLVFSILSQFTGLSYGTNKEGLFEIYELPDKSLIGRTLEEKLFNGIVVWAFHLVSDMAGSSNNAGKGTGIPGPLLSLAKELSVLPKIRDIKVTYKDDEISLSKMLSKIFNGTAFIDNDNIDTVRFDLRTEIGIYAYGVKQNIPVVINQCMVRAFYFVRRFLTEISNKQMKCIIDIKKLEPSHFLPWNNKCMVRMLTISSGVFCVVDASDSAIRAFINSPKSKTEFFTKFLLRTNFVGIGNFIISIKNDIKENLLGHLQVENSDIHTLGKEEEGLSTQSISIDLAVDIDNEGIYKYAFYRMYSTVKKAKEDFSAAQEVQLGMQREIFHLEDDETNLFNLIASISRHSLIVETEELIMRLFTLYRIDYIPTTDKSKYNIYMPFFRTENHKKIGYMFGFSMMEPIDWKPIKQIYNLDGIKVVALVELGENSEMRNRFVNHETNLTNGFVQYISIKELFLLMPGTEYDTYISHVNQFNSDIRKLIGYRTIVAPSDSSLEKLKKDIEDELRIIDFDKKLLECGLYENQIRIIRKNFWNRSLYQALIGNSSFAKSFISSEWYFRNHADFNVLEHTAVIAGYLKSVEQLLYSIIKLSEGTGKTIRKNGGEGQNYIEYNVENEPLIDSSLGSLIAYARHYSDLWDVNSYVKKYVLGKLDTYRDVYRNSHFHKCNLNKVEEIKEIRTDTFFINYLILGSMKISDSDKSRIGICIEQKVDKKQDISYLIFEEWLDRIVGGDVLLPKSSKIYFEIGVWGVDQWRLTFATVSGFDTEGYPLDIKWPYIGDDLKWNRILEKDEMEMKVISIIREYLGKGLYSGNLKTYSMISVGWFGHPHVLYQR